MVAFDYVIVGAGSAGCVVAARLSEDPSVRVLLLEAGHRDTAREVGIPAAFSLLFKGRLDWAFSTEPEAGCDGRAMYWPRGKVLGGSSSLNAMVYIRGAQADYDGWRDAGCTGWGFADVLPYFRRSEDNSRGADAFHGTGGPLPVSDQRSPSVLSRAFVQAAQDVGIPANPDFNGPRQYGAGLYQVTQRRGQRASTAAAFLRPALRRRNLEVRTLAHATRVVVERGRAVGVEVDFGGRREVFHADREVVLCGGAIGTPQLLQLSGIGPADELRALGIDVVVDAPNVGRNLQDHISSGLAFHCNQPITYFDADKRKGNLVRYLVGRSGPFSSNIAEAGAFVRTQADLSAPDLQFHFGPVIFLDHGLTPAPGHGFSLGPCLLQPRSRGTVTLRSADPLAAPAIRANYYSEPDDLRTMLEGLRIAKEIAAAPALRRYEAGRFLPVPGADDDASLTAHLRVRSETLYHPTSTAAMGASDDAVCDPQLRVRGVEGLRVVDASVLPTVPRGNTNAPVIMVAERAVDLMRGVEVPAQPRAGGVPVPEPAQPSPG